MQITKINAQPMMSTNNRQKVQNQGTNTNQQVKNQPSFGISYGNPLKRISLELANAVPVDVKAIEELTSIAKKAKELGSPCMEIKECSLFSDGSGEISLDFLKNWGRQDIPMNRRVPSSAKGWEYFCSFKTFPDFTDISFFKYNPNEIFSCFDLPEEKIINAELYLARHIVNSSVNKKSFEEFTTSNFEKVGQAKIDLAKSNLNKLNEMLKEVKASVDQYHPKTKQFFIDELETKIGELNQEVIDVQSHVKAQTDLLNSLS